MFKRCLDRDAWKKDLCAKVLNLSIAPSEKLQQLVCPPGYHISITADQNWSLQIRVTTAESCDLAMNANLCPFLLKMKARR